MTIDHDYLICLRRLREDEGGGYMACIPQLGLCAFHGDGETVEEALTNLEDIYSYFRWEWIREGRAEDLFPSALAEGDLCFNWRGN